MKNQWYRLIILILIILLPGCKDDDDDATTTPVSPAVSEPDYSGYYEINSSCTFHNCELAPASISEYITIDIDGSDCDFWGIQGSWDSNNKTAEGSSNEYCDDLTYDCMLCQVMSYDIEFSDVNHFSGDIYWQMDFSTGCYSNDCYYHYSIQGVRRTTSKHYESAESEGFRRFELNFIKSCNN
ncbi:MAG TPA: hypothetical protein VKO43_08435 [Candidatus Krumholzibacteriaceae bacterium]|nr:hypothetical protein [Candidatus Krumholzibacteriaceae bacterium]